MSSVLVYLERSMSPSTNQEARTVYNRTSVRPSSPRRPMTSCCVSGAPNDLEQKHREVAVPEDCRAKNRRTAFRRVLSTNEYTASHNTQDESLESRQ